ncbi:MAG: acyl-CoA carboxylase subunit beta, partial [Lentisphaerae bacterium]|nr:acyl-CoA carboxylase subunit beta [Lentisphaerota bacterium]
LYSALARLSGEVPRVTMIFGQTGASTVFPAALCDAAVMTEDSGVCIGRPDAVKHMVGETVDFATLGGARMHCTVSGLGDALAAGEQDAIAWARKYLSFFPCNRGGRPPRIEALPPEEPAGADSRLVPADPDKPFDILPLIRRIIDQGSLLELKELYAREAVTALARVEGRPLGIVANNSQHKGGILFPETCGKISRFITICDAFGIPLLFLADTPGFMIGTAAERSGIIRTASLLFTTIANASVPRLVIAVRRTHTAGLYAMAGPGFDPEEFLALPTAVISVFGRKALERFSSDRDMPPPARAALQEMLEACANPASLVDKGLLDAVIAVSDMRPRISAFLDKASALPRPDVRKQVLPV